MDEVDPQAVDGGSELVERVEPGLLRSPVVGVPPVLDKISEIVDRDPVGPAGVVDPVRETGVLEPAVEVLQDGLVHIDGKGLDLSRHGVPTPDGGPPGRPCDAPRVRPMTGDSCDPHAPDRSTVINRSENRHRSSTFSNESLYWPVNPMAAG